jgi:hypothetical protein
MTLKITINTSTNLSDEEQELIDQLNNKKFPEIKILGSKYMITQFKYNSYERGSGPEYIISCERSMIVRKPTKEVSNEY